MPARYWLRHVVVAAVGLAVAVAGFGGPGPQARAASPQLPVLNVTVFAAPSQVVWFPVLIQKTGLDAQHGFKLEIKQKPSQIAYADFAAGADPVCYCISTGAGGRFVEQGADIALLWNIFNYDYYVVSGNAAVHTLKDLEGKTLVADTVTGSWALAGWFLQQQGVDLSKVTIRSSNVRGAGGFAELLAGRGGCRRCDADRRLRCPRRFRSNAARLLGLRRDDLAKACQERDDAEHRRRRLARLGGQAG